MTKKQKYIEAAKIVAKAKNNSSRNKYCCYVLEDLKLSIRKFEMYFRPKNVQDECPWWNYCEISSNDYLEYRKTQLARSLALLFMAEMESK